MELNLHRLWIFMQVVEPHGFSAAAHRLYTSRPSVSRQVRRREQSPKATPIDRSGTRIRPTAEGEVLAEYGIRVRLLAQEAVAAVQQVSGLASGRFLVGGSTTVGTHLLPPLLARFAQQHPGIDCDSSVGDSEAVLGRLVAGDIGIVVVAGVPTASRLVTETVLDERLALISEHAVGRDVRAGTLAVLPVSPLLRSRPVTLVYRRDRLLSPAERAFITLLRSVGRRPRELPEPADGS